MEQRHVHRLPRVLRERHQVRRTAARSIDGGHRMKGATISVAMRHIETVGKDKCRYSVNGRLFSSWTGVSRLISPTLWSELLVQCQTLSSMLDMGVVIEHGY